MEEECHRVEAQLALKEARLEIQQLKQAVDAVRARLSDADAAAMDADVQSYFKDINAQNHKLENFLVNMELAQARLDRDREGAPGRRGYAGGSAPASVSGESPAGAARPERKLSCSCGSSPARSLTRSSTYTKLSDQTLAERNGHAADFPCLSGDGARDSGFVCSGESIPSRAELLLEAAFLSEETASLLDSYTQTFSRSLPHSFPHGLCHAAPPPAAPYACAYDKISAGDQPVPFLCALGGSGCTAPPCLSHHHHHHLCVHALREAGIQTEGSGAAGGGGGCSHDLDTIAEQRTFRSQACSPTSTWPSDDGEEEEPDSVTATASVTTATALSPSTEPAARAAGSPLGGAAGAGEEEEEGENRKEAAAAEEQRGSAEGTQADGNEEAELDARTTERSLKPSTDTWGGGTGGGCSAEGKQGETLEDSRDEELGAEPQGAGPEQPRTSQPRRSPPLDPAPPAPDGDGDGEAPACDKIQKSYWSRHFLVDLLAVAIPMVPTVAWLCRGPPRDARPIYHFGSLLRGCCTVALHSLRRGGGLRHYPAGGGGNLGGSTI